MFSRLAAIALGVAAVSAPLAAQDAPDADVKAIESFQLTMPVLNRMAQVQENMYATVKAHPELKQKYANQKDDDDSEANTIDDMAKKLDRIPELKAAIVKAGFTPRSYMIATIVTFQAAMTAAMLDMPGADKSKLSANARANAAFVKAHEAEFMRMQARSKEIEALTRVKSDDSADESEPDSSGSQR
jgi:type II secretory pathway component GspD/PulD (secretin)